MMSAGRSSAFQLLNDFGGRQAASPADPQEEIRAAHEEGYQKGFAEAQAEAGAACEARLAAALEEHAARLAAERESWQCEQADVLSAVMQTAIAGMQNSLRDRVSALLKPWLTDRLHERAMLDFEKAIDRALEEGARVELDGPADLLKSMREKFPVEVLRVAFTESDAPAVRAQIDDTRIELDMSAWLAELEDGGQ